MEDVSHLLSIWTVILVNLPSASLDVVHYWSPFLLLGSWLTRTLYRSQNTDVICISADRNTDGCAGTTTVNRAPANHKIGTGQCQATVPSLWLARARFTVVVPTGVYISRLMPSFPFMKQNLFNSVFPNLPLKIHIFCILRSRHSPSSFYRVAASYNPFSFLKHNNVTCTHIARQRVGKHTFLTTEDGVFRGVRAKWL
jgi:hypothetical protein